MTDAELDQEEARLIAEILADQEARGVKLLPAPESGDKSAALTERP